MNALHSSLSQSAEDKVRKLFPNFEIKEQIERNERCDPDFDKAVTDTYLVAGGTRDTITNIEKRKQNKYFIAILPLLF